MRKTLSDSPLEQEIEQAVACLQSGGVVAFPTDTLYGLGADAFNAKAIERIFQIKGRSPNMALPVLLADAADIALVAREVPAIAWTLAEKFFPGALSLVLKKAAILPDLLTGGSDTVAVRVPNHPIPRSLAKALGRPVTGTSANRSGFPPPKTFEEVNADLGDKVDIILRGGPPCGGLPSTVVDVSDGALRIIREGVVSAAEILAACGWKVEVKDEDSHRL